MLNPKMSYLRYLKVNSKTLISFCISLWFLLVFAMEISLTWSKTKKKKTYTIWGPFVIKTLLSVYYHLLLYEFHYLELTLARIAGLPQNEGSYH